MMTIIMKTIRCQDIPKYCIHHLSHYLSHRYFYHYGVKNAKPLLIIGYTNNSFFLRTIFLKGQKKGDKAKSYRRNHHHLR